MQGSLNMMVSLKRILSNDKALSDKGGGTPGKLSAITITQLVD